MSETEREIEEPKTKVVKYAKKKSYGTTKPRKSQKEDPLTDIKTVEDPLTDIKTVEDLPACINLTEDLPKCVELTYDKKKKILTVSVHM